MPRRVNVAMGPRYLLCAVSLACLPACIAAATRNEGTNKLQLALEHEYINEAAPLHAPASFLAVRSMGDAKHAMSAQPLIIAGGCLLALVLLGGAAFMYAPMSTELRTAIASYAVMIGCFFGLCISFVIYGIIQEYIMTHEYSHGGHFPSAAFLVLCNRVFGVFVLAILLSWRRETLIPQGSKWCSIPAISLFISTMCQHSSLRYVSFPVQVAFKSGKIVPTMVMGSAMLGRRYKVKDYVVAAVVTGCVIGFSMAVEDFSDKEAQSTKITGVVLMMIFLICDALTSNGEKKIFNTNPDMGTFQMMFVMALFSVGYSIITIVTVGNQATLFAFLLHNPIVCMHIGILSISAVIGQLFVFYVIKNHGPVVFSIMMTIRMMVSMTTSTILFGHQMSTDAHVYAAVLGVVLLGDAGIKFMEDRKKNGQEPKHHH